MAHTQTVWANDDHSDDVDTHNARMNQIETDLAAFGFPTKAGVPTDADVPAGAPAVDGMAIVDTTDLKLYIRSGGAWHFTALT